MGCAYCCRAVGWIWSSQLGILLIIYSAPSSVNILFRKDDRTCACLTSMCEIAKKLATYKYLTGVTCRKCEIKILCIHTTCRLTCIMVSPDKIYMLNVMCHQFHHCWEMKSFAICEALV